MKSGKLRDRITIQEKTETTDDYGGVTTAWADLTSVWAERYELRGDELLQSMQLAEQITTKWRTRYNSSINSECRVKWGGGYYEIKSVAYDPKKTMMELATRKE